MQRRVINEINNFIRIIMVGLTTTIIMQLIFLLLWSTMISAEVNIRGRGLEKIDAIPCNKGTNGTNCVCPNINCLVYNEKINGCHPVDCWKWNFIKQSCEETGKEMLGSLILQGIPVTGVFGSGFGNMGRWDIFGIYWLIWGSGCCLTCLCGCMGRCVGSSEEDKEVGLKAGARCGSCIMSIAIAVMWIWGIVVIANKDIEAPYKDWEGNDIMCPLI
tara:strand:- start:614 stop:1264 length:651 start_codon:yes stop_codon:yes gene_type:complete